MERADPDQTNRPISKERRRKSHQTRRRKSAAFVESIMIPKTCFELEQNKDKKPDYWKSMFDE